MTTNHSQGADWTPDLALEALMEGNRRFRENRRLERDLLRQVEATKDGQQPFAVVLSCIDSRCAPEMLFDQGIGDIFCARIAGNFVNDDILGSMEFGCQVVGARLVLVLGHTQCGAIHGACDGAELGHLTKVIGNLRPAVDATEQPADPKLRNSDNPGFVQDVAQRNVDLTVEAIRSRSDILREAERSGAIRIVGAMYDIASGEVELRG